MYYAQHNTSWFESFHDLTINNEHQIPAKEIPAKIYAIGTKWRLADCIKVAIMQVSICKFASCNLEPSSSL